MPFVYSKGLRKHSEALFLLLLLYFFLLFLLSFALPKIPELAPITWR